jgi:hypothetical protein
MAEVFGDIGGQPVTLNNAATEATLKQLVQAIGILSAKSGKSGGKSQADVEKELKSFQQQLGKTSKSSAKANKDLDTEQKNRKSLSDQIKSEEATREKAEKRTVASIGAVRGFTNALEGGVTKLTGIMSQLAGMGNSFSGAAAAFNSVPLIGGMLGSVFGAIATSGDKVFNTFKQAASVGANFNGNIRELVNAASGAGLTMDQFSAIIQKNGESLALMGGSATAGAKQLAAAGKAIRNSGVGDDLARLGFSTEDINNGIAKFGGMMARTGKQMDQTALAKISGEYMKNLAAISELTGKNKDALQAESDARMADAQYRLMLAKLDPEGAKNLEMLMNSIPAEHQAGLKEIMATGTAVSEEAQAAMAYMSKTGQSAMALGEQMRSSGTLTKSQAIEFDKARQGEMKSMAEEAKGRGGLLNVIGNFGNAVDQKFTVGVLNAAARTKDLGQALTEQEQAQKAAAKAQKDSLDPAQMQKLQQAIAETSNKMTVLLAQNLPKLQSAFDSLMNIIDKYVVPAFKLLMDNFELVVGVLVGFKLAMAAAQAAAKVNEFKANMWGKTAGDARFVKDIGGGGGGGGTDDKGKKKRKRRGGKGDVSVGDIEDKTPSKSSSARPSRLGGLAKGGVAAIGGVALGYGADALTDAGYEKAGAAANVGAEAASYGGMGAMIGSVVPGLGTAIGGAAGAAIGTGVGLYKNWGKLFGGSSDKSTPATPKFDETNAKNWAYSVFSGKASFDQVPEQYKEYATKLLSAPPKEWGAAAPVTPKGPINFNTRNPLALLQSVQESTPKSASMQPATSAEAARKTLENKAAEEKEKAAEMERLANKSKAAAGPAAGAATPAQESTDSAIAMLNTHMAELVRISKANNKISEKQLSVQEGLGGDLFSHVAA